MSDQLVIDGANIITLTKNNKFKAMTCAWTMMVDYDRILMLIGSQSDTGNSLCVGDFVGVSALNKDQKDIAIEFGENHSDSFDKFYSLHLSNYNGVYVVKDAKTIMHCQVLDIIHLKEEEKDHLVHLKVLNYQTNPDKRFLNYDEVY